MLRQMVRRTSSIKTRLLVSVIGLMIVSVVITLGPAIYFFSKHIEKNALEEAFGGMEGLELLLEKQKEDALQFGAMSSVNPNVVAAIAAKDTNAVLQIIGPLAKDGKIDFVTVTDEAGNVIARTHEPNKKGDSVLNQANVANALKGKAFAAIEPGTAVPLSARAGTPVKDAQGKIVGVVSAGYDAGKEATVDQAKKLFNVDATIFKDDVRIATTVMQENKRVVGTKLAPAVADIVLKQGKVYNAQIDVVGKPYMTAYKPIIGPDGKTVGIVFAGKNLEGVNQAKRELLQLIALVFTVVLLLTIGLIYWGVKRFAQPIQALADAASSVAEGDLTRQVTVQTNDEIGQLAGAFNSMILQLQNLVRQVTSLSQSVEEAAAALQKNAEQSSKASEQIADSISDVATGAERQAQSISSTSHVVESMSAGVEEVAANAHLSAEAAAKMAAAAASGGEAVHTAVTQMRDIANAVNTSAEVVAVLGVRSQEIGQIVAAIGGIAAQTNLLALNAAIEAARAGEQGRGFAVVAEEVRKLAEQSQLSAEQIARLIHETQSDTDKAVQAMQAGTEQVKVGAAVVEEAGASFATIRSFVEEVTMQVRQISAAAQEMADGSQNIVNSIRDIDSVSKNNAGQTQTVAAATEEQAATVGEMAQASQNLLQMAQELQEVVRRFKVE